MQRAYWRRDAETLSKLETRGVERLDWPELRSLLLHAQPAFTVGSMEPSSPTPSFLAARLAILALRATADGSTSLTDDRAALDTEDSPVSSDAAANELASKPKPLFCDAEARHGTLVVSCRTQSETPRHLVREFQLTRIVDAECAGFIPYLRERYGDGDHLVAVFGRDESLRVPYSVAERWSLEYGIASVGYAADDIDNPLAASKPEYVESRRNGAKGILLFRSSVSADFSSITLYSDGENDVSEELRHFS